MAWNAGAIVGTASLNTQKWTKGASGMGSVMKGAMGVAVAAIALAGKAFIEATKDSQEFLKAFSNVDTIVDETSVDLQKLAKDVMLLDPALGSATEMSDGLYMSFSAGAKTAEEAMNLTVTSAKFAKAGLTDLSTSVDVLSTAMNAYGDETVSAEYASDLFFQTIQYGKTTGAELASSIGKSIPQFAALGIPLDNLTAGLAAMTKQGLSASESTTQLNALTNAFIKPSAAMTAAMEEQGIASGSALLETEGLTGALEFLETATGGNKEAIGQLVPNIRGMKAVFALSGEGAEIYTETLEHMQNSLGATEKAFQEQEKTIDTAKNAFQNLSITAGNLGNVFVNKIAVGATGAATGMQKFLFSARGMETVAEFAYIFSGALNTLKAILTPLVTGIMTAYKEMLGNLFENLAEMNGGASESNRVFSFLGGTVKVLTTYMSVFAKFINTVVDALFDLIPMLVEGGKAVGYFLAGDYEKASAAGKEFIASTKDMVTGVKENALDIGTTVKEAFASYGDDAGKVTKDIEESWSKSATNSKNFVLENYDEMLTGQSAFAQKLSANRKKQEEKAKEDADEALDEIGDSNEKAAASFSNVWTKLFEKIGESIDKSSDLTVGKLTDLATSAASALSTGSEYLFSFIADQYNKELGELESFYDDRISVLKNGFAKEQAALTDAQENVYDDLYANELDRLKEALDQKLITKEEYLLAETDLQEQFNQQTISTQAELDEILANDKLSHEEKQSFVDKFYANQATKITTEKEAGLLALEKKAADEKNKVAKKAFEAEKAQKISQVWLDAFASQMGYISWGAPLGPPGWIAAAIAGTASLTMAGVQTGLIASERYTPSYALGTNSHIGGMAIVGDQPSGKGGELVNLPTGTSVTPTVQTNELMDAMNGISNIGNNTGMTNNFDFSGANFGGVTESEMETIINTQLTETLRAVM